MPLANSFLCAEELPRRENFYPLEVLLCEACGLSQLTEVIPPEKLFKNYIYVTSTSDTVIRHAQWLADAVVRRFSLTPQDLVVEVASNDGCILRAFKAAGMKTFGIEPAENIAALARANGIETLSEFFNSKTADSIRNSKGVAKVIVARHVFGHVDDLRDFVEGLALLLADDGVVIIEVPYLADLLERVAYDTIYHEHLSYFSLNALSTLFSLHRMGIFDTQRIEIHGGSILVYIRKSSGKQKEMHIVRELLEKEKFLHLDTRDSYIRFAQRVGDAKEKLCKTLSKLRSARKRIVGYGAAAKGNTLLNYCGIDTSALEYIVDKNVLKHNLYTPGTHIPVYPVERITHDQPDYMLILAWNFASEIIEQQSRFKKQGGRFIIPVPEVAIV